MKDKYITAALILLIPLAYIPFEYVWIVLVLFGIGRVIQKVEGKYGDLSSL